MKINEILNSNKGISLISLVVTIIILLILAVVNINMLVGENGILVRASESSILSMLADILFNLDSNIIDINTDNILSDKKMISSEMIKELANRNLVEKTEIENYEDLIQYKIKDKRMDNLFVSFNGDIWLNNYKRGKIQLTPNVNTIYTPNTQTKITVIDGTVEEYIPNSVYYLHALKGRSDFSCWVNKYGEVTSVFPDTMIDTTHRKDMEYTAIYGLDINLLVSLGFETTCEMIDDEVWFHSSLTYLDRMFMARKKQENSDSYTYIQEVGTVPLIYSLAISDNYEDLMEISTDEILEKSIFFRINEDYLSLLSLDELKGTKFSQKFEKLKNYGDWPENGVKYVDVFRTESGGYLPCLEYDDLKYSSLRFEKMFGYTKKAILDWLNKNEADRLYYRGMIFYGICVNDVDENGDLIPKLLEQKYFKLYNESAIKYFDI